MDDIKINQYIGNWTNKDSWTVNGVIYSHPGLFEQDLSEFHQSNQRCYKSVYVPNYPYIIFIQSSP